MSEHKKTFGEWWDGLHAQSRETQHLIKGVLREQGFKQVEGTPDSLAMTWERHAGEPTIIEAALAAGAAKRGGYLVSLSPEARAWLLCHLIAEISKASAVRLAACDGARVPSREGNGQQGPFASTLREAALAEDAKLMREILKSLNDASVR